MYYMNEARKQSEAPILLSQAEAAHLLGVERTTIWRMVKRKELARVTIGSRSLITRASVEEFVRSKTQCA